MLQMCMHNVFMYAHGCACLWKPEVDVGYDVSSSSSYFLRRGPSLDWTNRLVSESQGSPGLHLPHSDITDAHHCAQLFMWVLVTGS